MGGFLIRGQNSARKLGVIGLRLRRCSIFNETLLRDVLSEGHALDIEGKGVFDLTSSSQYRDLLSTAARQ